MANFEQPTPVLRRAGFFHRCSPTSPCRSSTSTSSRPGKRWATRIDGSNADDKGLANYRLVRYADDWVVMVAGDRADAERLRDEAATVLLPMGLRLSPEKTKIVHIDEGFEFLGMRIQRHRQRGSTRRYVYTYPTRRGLAAVKARVKAATINRTTNQTLTVLLHRLNPMLRGWTSYHRHGAASKTFAYLSAYTWRRVWTWLRHKHPKATVAELRRRYFRKWWPDQDGVRLFNPATVSITRYRYRGNIPAPWVATTGSAA